MSHEIFHPDDVFVNRVKTHPEFNLFIYQGELTINNHQNLIGQNRSVIIRKGHIDLFEMNPDKPSGQNIYPWIHALGANYKHTLKRPKLPTTMFNPIIGKRTVLSGANCNLGSLFDQATFSQMMSSGPTAQTAGKVIGRNIYSATITRRLTTPVSQFTGPDIDAGCADQTFFLDNQK